MEDISVELGLNGCLKVNHLAPSSRIVAWNIKKFHDPC